MANETRIICLLLTMGNVFCQTSDDAKNLFTELFKNYNKQVRPINDQYDAIRVFVDFEMSSIHALDEVAEKIAVAGHLNLIWWDEQLVWNRSANNDIYDMLVLQVCNNTFTVISISS